VLSIIVSLFVVLVVIRAAVLLVRMFLTWLGRGRVLRSAIEEGRVGGAVVCAVETANAWRGGGPRQRLSSEQRAAVRKAHVEMREEYVRGMRLGWYQVVIVFLVGSVLGLILEQAWMLVTAGNTESRVGLVWGPFSPLYGTGAVLLTIIMFYLYRRKISWLAVLLISAVVGTSLEQLTGWGMETLFHAESWTYLAYPDHITKWTAWRFALIWGMLGLVWEHEVMPELLYCIGMPTTTRQVTFVFLLAVYLAADIFMTVACFTRMTERDAGVPADSAFDQYLDANYSDAFVKNRFQNLTVSSADADGS